MGCSTSEWLSNIFQETSGEHLAIIVMQNLVDYFLCCQQTLSDRLVKLTFEVTKGIKQCIKQKLYVSDHFHKTVQKYPNKVAIIFEDRQLTFRELDELSNRIANVLRATGLRHGDVVALFMTNCLEYLAVYLAMCKLGVTGE